MKKVFFSLLLLGGASFSFGQNSNCVVYGLFGSYSSATPVWESVSVPNSDVGLLHTGTCPVKVGIGTDVPSYQLEVAGTTRTSTLSTSKLALGIDPQIMEGHFHMKVPASSAVVTYDVLRIENADRQLLNLENSGLLRAREVMVDAQTWPD